MQAELTGAPPGRRALGAATTDPPVRPSADDLGRWQRVDREARSRRLERLRVSLDGQRLDAYVGLGSENARYLTGFVLGDGEEKVCGSSGRFVISADESIVVADSRYRLQAMEECPDSRVVDPGRDLVDTWPGIVAGLRAVSSTDGRVRRVGVEAGQLSHATWEALAAATPDVELVPADGLVEAARAVKEPAELERIRAACAIADEALRATLPDIRPGVSERDLALALEWRMRTSGSDGLAFDIACLGGPRAALPHGSPGSRTIRAGEVLLFDFGAKVDGYRSDMTRTLFVGEPAERDLGVFELVAQAQGAAIELLRRELAAGREITNRAVDSAARDVIVAAGHGPHFGHGTGHGIGLATHELPSIGRAADAPLPSPTVFSVEPGVYLEGETGVRIEDLVAIDAATGSLELLTRFPRAVTVVGA